MAVSSKPAMPQPKLAPKPLLIGDVAARLQLSERTVRRYIAEGSLRKMKLPGRLVRVSIEELVRFERQLADG